MNVVTRKYVIMIRNKFIFDFERQFSLYSFYSAITYEDVNYDYMPESFAAWKNK